MFLVKHIVNGFYPIVIGEFNHIQLAADAIKSDVSIHSAIFNPKYQKSLSKDGNVIRIDYGARDCYYVIEGKNCKCKEV